MIQAETVLDVADTVLINSNSRSMMGVRPEGHSGAR